MVEAPGFEPGSEGMKSLSIYMLILPIDLQMQVAGKRATASYPRRFHLKVRGVAFRLACYPSPLPGHRQTQRSVLL